uniref:Uncharacterized protein n=1 Tax=Panagrolaimus davidi TaxID=227884 RepID=A0A914Q4H7_9BILA
MVARFVCYKLLVYPCTKCRTIYDASGKNGHAKRPLSAIIFDENAEEFLTTVSENAHYYEGPRNLNQIRVKSLKILEQFVELKSGFLV